jgi:hypothetical protein
MGGKGSGKYRRKIKPGSIDITDLGWGDELTDKERVIALALMEQKEAARMGLETLRTRAKTRRYRKRKGL